MIHATGNVSLAGSNKRWTDLRKGANCKLLLHCDGADASTTITDAIGTHSPAAQADAQIDTAQKRFGTGSILFDGTGDYVSIADHADWNFGTGNFTIDLWFRSSATSQIATFFSQSDDADNYFTFGCRPNLNLLAFSYKNAPGSAQSCQSSSVTIADNTWYHVAVIRGWGGADVMAVTLNGLPVATLSTTGHDLGDFAADVTIGLTGSSYTSGWIDELRVVKGTAMWTKTFIPPIGPYI